MLNIEQELECSSGHELRNLRMDGEYIVADLYYANGVRDYSDMRFSAKTGVLHQHSEGHENPWRLRPKSATRPINHFYLFAGHREWPKEDWVKLLNEHWVDDGAAAGVRAKEHNGRATTALSPFRFMVKREVQLAPILDYTKWAEFRFASGEWQPVPWADELVAPEHHHAHISTLDPSKVAFWSSEIEAAQDQTTSMAPGRYLKQYFGDVLSNEEIRDWAVKVDNDVELHFAHTPDEIYKVYTTGPHSCMVYPDDNPCWSGQQNPARIYGAGDLAVAYLTRREKIIARCLVWPEKKVAQRRYGDIERIEMALEAEGYRFDSSDSSADGRGSGLFNGARLLRVVPDRYPSHFVMPYLDFGYSADYIDGDDDHLQMKLGGTIFAQCTNGLSGEVEDDTYTCERCGDTESEDDCTWLGDSVYCDSCYGHVAVSCDRCQETIHREHANRLAGGDDYCGPCYRRHTTSCDYCGDHAPNGDIVAVYDARAEDEVHADACPGCIDDDENIQMGVNGLWIDVSTATQCTTCHEYFSGNLTEEDCPTQSCVDARAEQEEMETV